MIKNKKYKSFSLIEAMVLFTALSLMLLAFLPIMLKRTQKVMESDCVGGLRGVRKEFTNPGTYNITVPDNIASALTVTLLGGGGAGHPVRRLTYTNWIHECDNNRNLIYCMVYTHTMATEAVQFGYTKTLVGKGGNATCNGKTGVAGASGVYYPKWRVPHRGPNFYDYPTAYDYNVRSTDLMAAVPGESGGSEKLFLEGGSIPTKKILGTTWIYDDIKSISDVGKGQGCKRNNTSENFSVGNAPIRSLSFDTFYYAASGYGGGAGGYAKFQIQAQGGSNLTLDVGKGETWNESNLQNGGQTSLRYGSNEYIAYGGRTSTAKNASGSNTCSECGQVSDSITQSGNVTVLSTVNGSSAKYHLVNIGLHKRFGQAGGDSALAPGGRGACDFDQNYKSSDCTDPNGKPGYLGSGGGGGSCGENGCGTGGKGGDGIAIVEYMEYCK